MNRKRPTISVIIPAYNAEHFIRRAIDSVLAQTYPASEIIVVDDGSSDNTPEVVRSYGEQITLVCQKNGGGAQMHRNAGIDLATGDLLAFLDADDFWDPPKLGCHVGVYTEHADVGLTSSAYYFLDTIGSAGAVVRRANEIAWDTKVWLTSQSVFETALFIVTPTIVVPKQMLNDLRFDRGLPTAEDRDMWIKLLQKAPSYCISRPLVTVVNRANSLSNCDIASDYSNMLRVVAANRELIGPQMARRQEADVYVRWAGRLLNEGQARRARAGREAIDERAVYSSRLVDPGQVGGVVTWPPTGIDGGKPSLLRRRRMNRKMDAVECLNQLHRPIPAAAAVAADMHCIADRPARCSSSFWYRWANKALVSLSWALSIAVISQLVLIRWLGDVWWPGTILMFAPRWPLLLPIGVLGIACLIWRRSLLRVNLAVALLLAGPIMGFCIPLPCVISKADGYPIRIFTANTGGGVHPELLREEIKRAEPDVVAFQEFPGKWLGDVIDSTWQRREAHGLAVASRFPILESSVCSGSQLGHYHDVGLRVRIQTPAGDLWVCCIYLNSPRNGFEEFMVTRRGIFGIGAIQKNTQQRGEQSLLVSEWVGELNGPVVVAGDMNLPPESYFFRRDWSSRRDAFPAASFGYGHTWFTRWHGVRIDHVLVDASFAVSACHVAGYTGGDHHPVVADLVRKKS